MNFDFQLFNFLNQFAGKSIVFDKILIFFANYSGYFLIFILGIFILKRINIAKELLFKLFFSVVLSRFFITEIIRFLWNRPRPFVVEKVNLLITHEVSGSFPSGHAAFYFAISTIVSLYSKKLGILFFVLSFLMVIARVFSGVHWPTDILVGAFIGIISGWGINKIFKKINKN